MEERDLKQFESRLKQLQEEILKVIAGEDDDSGSRDFMDEIDKAQNVIEQAMGSLTSSSQRSNLAKVEEALERIKKNAYGICEECGEEIPMKRLEALPFALYCITCQQKLEEEY
jgi:DnaK suppressor protein